MAGLVPALAGHVELERERGLRRAPSPVSKSKQVRPAPSSAWISPTKMPCIRPRALSVEFSYVGRERVALRGSATGCADRTPRLRSDVLEPLVTGQFGDRQHPLHAVNLPIHELVAIYYVDDYSPQPCPPSIEITVSVGLTPVRNPAEPVVDEEVRTAEVVAAG